MKKPVKEIPQCESVLGEFRCEQPINGHRKPFGRLKHNNGAVSWTDEGAKRDKEERDAINKG